jgi:hypothetical protein
LIRENGSFRTVTGPAVLVLGWFIAASSLLNWHFEYLIQDEIIFQAGFSWSSLKGPTPSRKA